MFTGNIFRSGDSDFCAIENLEYSFIDFLFITFIQILMKELARILIHVCNTFNTNIYFKAVLPIYLVMVEQ